MKWIHMQRREVTFYCHYLAGINYSYSMQEDLGFCFKNFIFYCSDGRFTDSYIREDVWKEILDKILENPNFFQKLSGVFDKNFQLLNSYVDLIEKADFSAMDDKNFSEFYKKTFDIYKKSFSVLRMPLIIEELMDKLPGKVEEIKKFGKSRNKLAEVLYASLNATDKILEEAGRRLNIPKELQEFAFPEEIISCFESNVKIDLNELEQRRVYMVMIDEGEVRVVFGDETKKIMDNIEVEVNKELKGKCGSAGKARGNVKIISSFSELSKVTKPSIVVCKLTNLEFTPYFHKFLAVVTEDSGILNHSAVTAREFGIPCIVGVKGATELLKDNDLVEVDANKGIVRKLESD